MASTIIRTLTMYCQLATTAFLIGCGSQEKSPTASPPVPPLPPPPVSGTEPVFTPGVQTALWSDDFDDLAEDTAIFGRYATMPGESGIHVDASGGLNTSRALRVDWTPKSGCDDSSHLIEKSFPATPEVFAQFNVRFDAGFIFDWIGRGGPCIGNAKKLFFLWTVQGARFDFVAENHRLVVGADINDPLFVQNTGGNAVSVEDLGDGAWHRITFHVRQSSTPTAPDGFIHVWIDGVQKWRVDNVASGSSGGYNLFKIPTTFNQGSPVTQSEWIDNLILWKP